MISQNQSTIVSNPLNIDEKRLKEVRQHLVSLPLWVIAPKGWEHSTFENADRENPSNGPSIRSAISRAHVGSIPFYAYNYLTHANGLARFETKDGKSNILDHNILPGTPLRVYYCWYEDGYCKYWYYEVVFATGSANIPSIPSNHHSEWGTLSYSLLVLKSTELIELMLAFEKICQEDSELLNQAKDLAEKDIRYATKHYLSDLIFYAERRLHDLQNQKKSLRELRRQQKAANAKNG